MIRKTAYYLLCSLLLISFSARCGFADPGDVALGVKASTLGLGIEGTASLLPKLNLRAGANAFNFSFDSNTSDIDYDLDVDLLSFPIVLDWHPFTSSGFRITGGILINRNKADADASSQNSFTIGDDTYTAAELGNLTGKVGFKEVAPYVGIGWGNAVGKSERWSFSCDFGVVFQGEADIDLTASGPIASDPTFQANLAREKKELEDELDDYKYYPVVSLGLTYKF